MRSVTVIFTLASAALAYAQGPMAEYPRDRLAERIAEQVQAIKANPTFEEQAQRLAEGMEAVTADPNLQKQAQVFIEKVDAMRANSNLQEQVKDAAERLGAIVADQNFQEQAERVDKQMKALISNLNQQHSTDNFVDNLVDKFFDRAFNPSRLQDANLDTSVLAKPGALARPSSLVNPSLAIPSLGMRRSTPSTFSHPRPDVASISAQKYLDQRVSARSMNVRSTFSSEPHSSSNPANDFGMPKKVDDLKRQLFASAIALALALSPNAALADQQLSAFQKVDKTGVIGGIASVIENGIDAAHNGLSNGGMEANTYGISICLFTLLVRTITLPLTTTQLRSSVKMQQIQPLQKKIQAALPRQSQTDQKNRMMAELFKAANVNPLAGCFPALIQIPVFISLYRALTNLVAEDKLGESFLWLPSLEGPIYAGETSNWFTSIFSTQPVLGWDDTLKFLSLPAILVVTQSATSKLLQPPRPEGAVMTEQEKISQNIIGFLPFIIALFSINVPAGLSVYWIANNIFTTGFTLAIKAGIQTEELPEGVQKIMRQIEGPSGGEDGESSAEGDIMDAEFDEEPPVPVEGNREQKRAAKRQNKKRGKKKAKR